MTDRNHAEHEFDYEHYRNTLVTYGINAFKDYYTRSSYDGEAAISQAASDAADEVIYSNFSSVDEAIGILEGSPFEPGEWQPFVEGDGWRYIVRAMANSVARQDFYDEMDKRGYLNDGVPTDRLTNRVSTQTT